MDEMAESVNAKSWLVSRIQSLCSFCGKHSSRCWRGTSWPVFQWSDAMTRHLGIQKGIKAGFELDHVVIVDSFFSLFKESSRQCLG